MAEYLKAYAIDNRADAVKLAARGWKLLGDTMNEKMSDIVVDPAQTLVRAKLGRTNTDAVTAEVAEKVIYELTENGFTNLVD
jgi:hypothetical protein